MFVRLTGCHLRCHYCDTAYAFNQGQRMTLDAIIQQVNAHACPLVQITGGEPLLQHAVHPLMTTLCDQGKTVLIETSGASDISLCDPRVIRIMDLKTPGSGEADKNLWPNIEHLKSQDQVKFVICDREDYLWARDVIQKYDLTKKVHAVLVSCAGNMPASDELAGTPGLPMLSLAQWVLQDHLPLRLQTQLHKLIWDPMQRGV